MQSSFSISQKYLCNVLFLGLSHDCAVHPCLSVLSRRGYHSHVNTACTCIKSSGFILTFEYLDFLFNRTLGNKLTFSHCFQTSARTELISSVLGKKGAGHTPGVGATWAGRGAWGWTPPHLPSPLSGQSLGFFSPAICSDTKGG